MELRESQIEFYHKLAPDYDRQVNAEAIEENARYRGLFPTGAAFHRGLDLGCGTGNWTRGLLEVCDQVLAVDASPDMIAKASEKLGERGIDYRVVDILAFPDLGTFDVVFSTFWVSHVPLELHDDFWAWVARSLEIGGEVIFQDSMAQGPGGGGDCRRLPSGETFRIVKNAYDFDRLLEVMSSHGLAGTITMTSKNIYMINAQRS